MKIFKSVWFEPYKNGKPRLKTNTRYNFGVYAIKKISSGEVVYIGYSVSNLYKTIYRHFQTWKDKQYRVTLPKSGYKIKILFTSKDVAHRLERLLINRYKPKFNIHTYEDAIQPTETISKYEENIIFVRPNEDVTEF